MWLILNNKVKPFDDVRVRQAINYLMPRDEIVKDVYHGMAAAWHGVISDVTPGYENLKPYDFDPDKAKKLLADAGYADGFEADLVFSAGVPEMENFAVILQSTAGQARRQARPQEAAGGGALRHRSVEEGADGAVDRQPDPARRQLRRQSGLHHGPAGAGQLHQLLRPRGRQADRDRRVIVDPKARLEHHKGVQAKIQEGAPMG